MKSTLRFSLLVVVCSVVISGQAHSAAGDSVAGRSAPVVVSAVAGSVAVISLHAGGEMIVDSMRWVGKGVEVVLKGAGNASRAVLTLTADATKGASLAVGQSVKVVAVGSGYVLTASGKALAMFPERTTRIWCARRSRCEALRSPFSRV